MDLKNPILMIIWLSWFASLVMPLDQPDLFHKGQKVEKLIIKNQIGYHFKKVVREVSQELFISRKIDVSAMFLGTQVLLQAEQKLMQYCIMISDTSKYFARRREELKGAAIKPVPPRFVHNTDLPISDFAQAKAACEVKGMRLPEMYQIQDAKALGAFLSRNNLLSCFAGLVPDTAEAVFRFISTGIPIWKGPFDLAYDKTGKPYPLPVVMDDSHAKFIYGQKGTLGIRWDVPSPIQDGRFAYGSHNYRDTEKGISEIEHAVVCEVAWDGTRPKVRPDSVPSTTVITHRSKRGIKGPADHESYADETKTLREYCYSVVSMAEDTKTEMLGKMTSLLSLVDISVHMENNHGVQQIKRFSDDLDSDSESSNRPKIVVPLFMAKFFFTTGFKLIWGLYGIVDKIRTEKRLRRIEKNVASAQQQASENSDLIRNLSQVAYGNSIAIEQLNITTKELMIRVTTLEHRVDQLDLKLDQTVNILDANIMISLIASLIGRIQQSMNSGYDVLKDVIHSSLQGQTSPLLLPLDQIDLVQNKVRRVSTSVLDPDFIKMQSIIVSDPNDPHLLLVIINAAALSREEVELVQLVSIPYFENEKTFFPILDYQTVVLNQLKRTYSILQEQEEISCLSNRCYVSDVERPVSDKTCGIPQFFDEHTEACIADETTSTGVFLKPMLPDGILFAFQDEVTSQLFCQGAATGLSRKLKGTGIMQLPNGCLLSLVDKKGTSTKVKGPPIYRMMDADDLALIMSGPLSSTHSQGSQGSIQKKATYDGLITSHLSSVIQQMKTSDHRLDTQSTYIWSLLGVLVVVSILVIVIMLLLYRYSTRFRLKVNMLRERFAEISHQITGLVKAAENAARRGLQPPAIPVSPKVTDLLSRARERIANVEKANQATWRPESPSYKNSETSTPGSKDNTYISFQPVDGLPRGNQMHPYPSLGPLLQRRLTEYELQELDTESEEVQELTKVVSKD